jgi:hypothetical protein
MSTCKGFSPKKYPKSYKQLVAVGDYKRCSQDVESELLAHLKNCAKIYVDASQLFNDATNGLKFNP